MGKAGERLDKRLRARVFACVCVCMHVCVHAHIPTMADTALLFHLCHPPHQNTRLSVTEASWPVQQHDTVALRNHPCPLAGGRVGLREVRAD